MAADKQDKVLNFSSEREQSRACSSSAEREKNQGKNFLNVPNLRFPEFTDEWKICKVGDYGKIITGSTPPTSDNTNYAGGTRLWASPVDLGQTKFVTDTQTKLSSKGFSKTRKLPVGSVLVTCIGSTIGKMGMAATEMSTNQQINSIVVDSQYDNHFVYYALQSRFPRYLTSVAVQAVPIMSKSSFEKLQNYKTTFKEQKKIGALLNLIDERISTQIRIIEDLKQLRSAIRNRIFKKIQQEPEQIVQIKEILTYEQPTKYLVSNTEYVNDSSLIPVLTANKAFILGYTFEKQGVYDKGDCIILDDFTLDCKIVGFPFKVKSSAIKILRAKDRNMLRYAFEYLKYLDLETSEHKRHYITEIEPIDISLPSQEKIEDIMHLFESLDMRIVNAEKTWSSYLSQKKFLLRELFV